MLQPYGGTGEIGAVLPTTLSHVTGRRTFLGAGGTLDPLHKNVYQR